MCDLPKELHNKIIDAGKEIWQSLYNKCDGSYVGELGKTEIEFDGKTYQVEIDCYWEGSDYFDYRVVGNGVDCRKFVACWM